MQITLPHPSKYLNPNGDRANGMAVSAARKRARSLAATVTAAAADAYTHYTTYHITWNYFGTQLPDDDNIIARCKSYKDGICDALGINDKTLHCSGVTFIRDKATKKTLTIHLGNDTLLLLTSAERTDLTSALTYALGVYGSQYNETHIGWNHLLEKIEHLNS